jgi:asparagine N-glycosylation enzyme membrane subunit Stt3
MSEPIAPTVAPAMVMLFSMGIAVVSWYFGSFEMFAIGMGASVACAALTSYARVLQNRRLP